MPKYDNSKIYLITNKNGQSNGFIGATTKPYLSSKLQSDIVCYENFKSGKTKVSSPLYKLFDEHGVSNCRIVLVENYPCKSKDDLNSKLFEIVNRTTNCINNNPAYLPVSLGSPLDEGIEQTEEEKQEYIINNTQTICGCGGRYTIASYKAHLKSKRHFKHIHDIENEINEEIKNEELYDQNENQNGPY
jgi:hypothetical protein